MATWAGRSMGLGALVLLVAADARAEEWPGLREGTRIRASIVAGARPEGAKGARRLTGTLVGIDDSTLLLRTSRDEPPVAVPRQDVAQVEVSVRKSQRGKGAVVGLGVGAWAAVALTLAADCDSCLLDYSGSDYARLALLWGAAGAALGAHFAREKWEAVPSARWRLAVAPTRGRGVQMRLSLRF